jgi:hypothetical protein
MTSGRLGSLSAACIVDSHRGQVGAFTLHLSLAALCCLPFCRRGSFSRAEMQPKCPALAGLVEGAAIVHRRGRVMRDDALPGTLAI